MLPCVACRLPLFVALSCSSYTIAMSVPSRNAIRTCSQRDHAPYHINRPPAKSASKAHPTWRSLSGLPVQWSAFLSPSLQSFVYCTSPTGTHPRFFGRFSSVRCVGGLASVSVLSHLQDCANCGCGHCSRYEAMMAAIVPRRPGQALSFASKRSCTTLKSGPAGSDRERTCPSHAFRSQ